MHICVAIGILKNDKNEIFLVKRERGNFPGLWALPGGKLESGEGVFEAAMREIKEETGIKAKINGFLGTAVEIIHEADHMSSTVLFFCELEMTGEDIVAEHESRWFALDELSDNSGIVHSDLLFLKHFYLEKDMTYMKLECVHRSDGSYLWK